MILGIQDPIYPAREIANWSPILLSLGNDMYPDSDPICFPLLTDTGYLVLNAKDAFIISSKLRIAFIIESSQASTLVKYG